MLWKNMINAIIWPVLWNWTRVSLLLSFKRRKRTNRWRESVVVKGKSRFWSWLKVPVQQKFPWKKHKVVGHLKIQVIPDLELKTITKVVKEQLEPSVELTIDNSISYIRFDKLKGSHKAVISGKEAIKVPWVHIVISNAKKIAVGCSS